MRLRELATRCWLFLFFVILFVLMALLKISFKEIWEAIASLEIWQVLVLLFLYFLISACSIIARKYLLYSLSFQAKLKNLIYIHFSTMAAHYSTPAKLGFPLAVYLLNKSEKVPYAAGTAMIFVELFVSTGICGIIALFGSLFYFADNMQTVIFALLCILAISAICFQIGVSLLKKKEKKGRISAFIGRAYNSFRQIPPINLIIYILIILFIQVIGSLNLVFLCLFFSTPLSVISALIASSTAFFLGAMSMIPMGIGIREASMLYYLHHFGISNEIGIAIVTVQRLISTGLSFALGSVAGMFLGIKKMIYESPKIKM